MARAVTKRWGNSLGIVIPKDLVDELGLKPHEEVVFEVHKRSGTVLKDLFGAVKWSKSPKDLLKESRKELDSRYGL
ncbi:MAG: AbrB/MazE/SpoVT family DNA-binding domain-containing protein [Nanoarchaeota archaeon]